MTWSGWALVGFACISFLVTWSVTLVGASWWLNKQFEHNRHTMYGALGTSKNELKDIIEDAERRLEVIIREIKGEFKEFRMKHDKLEDRVRQLEMLRLAEKAGKHV